MCAQKSVHMTHYHFRDIPTAIQAFLNDRKAGGASPNTIEYYRRTLTKFSDYCSAQNVTRIDQITADTVRSYLLYLEQQNHSPGGRHAHFRAVRALLLWLESESDGEYQAPIRKVKPPKLPKTIIEGASLDDISAMLATCKGNDFIDLRDKAILLFLLDGGARASEVVSVDISDVDFAVSSVLIRHGKGDKQRVVFFSKATRRAIIAYLKKRTDDSPALWITEQGERLTRFGLDRILRTRAKLAGLANPPSAHDFRRAFALNMLRAGCDVFSVQRLMGHSDLATLRKYVAQTQGDLQKAHQMFAPANNLKKR